MIFILNYSNLLLSSNFDKFSILISFRKSLSDVRFDVSNFDNFFFLLSSSFLNSLFNFFAEEFNMAV